MHQGFGCMGELVASVAGQQYKQRRQRQHRRLCQQQWQQCQQRQQRRSPGIAFTSVARPQVRHACTSARESDSFSEDNPGKTLAGGGWDASAFQTSVSKGTPPVFWG